MGSIPVSDPQVVTSTITMKLLLVLLLSWHVPLLKPTVDTVDMVDTAVDTAVDTVDMVDTVVDTVDTVARDLPKQFLKPYPNPKPKPPQKPTPMPKPKLTVTVMAVDTDMEVMVDTVEVME